MTAARGELIPLDKQWRTLMHSRVNSPIWRGLEGRRSVCRQCLQTAGNSRSSMLAAGLLKSSAREAAVSSPCPVQLNQPLKLKPQ